MYLGMSDLGFLFMVLLGRRYGGWGKRVSERVYIYTSKSLLFGEFNYLVVYKIIPVSCFFPGNPDLLSHSLSHEEEVPQLAILLPFPNLQAFKIPHQTNLIMSSAPLPAPSTHRALVLTSITSHPTVQSLPKPLVTPGSAIIRVLYASVLPYARIVYNGTRDVPPFPVPFVPGSAAIGRVSEVRPDATTLVPGQLVFVDCFIRGRDDPTALILSGYRPGHTENSKKLMEGEWKDSTYAEFAKCPLENCYPVDEGRMCGAVKDGGLGYSIPDLMSVWPLMVSYGGLKDISLLAGETIIVAPATGTFGGGAVIVALAMGAWVVAVGRNQNTLDKIKRLSERIEVVKLTGEVEADAKALGKFGPLDAYIDFSPPAAAKSTHIMSCLTALKPNGRVSLIGGIRDDVAIPYFMLMIKSLKLMGKWMYERDDCLGLIKILNAVYLNSDRRWDLRWPGRLG